MRHLYVVRVDHSCWSQKQNAIYKIRRRFGLVIDTCNFHVLLNNFALYTLHFHDWNILKNILFEKSTWRLELSNMCDNVGRSYFMVEFWKSMFHLSGIIRNWRSWMSPSSPTACAGPQNGDVKLSRLSSDVIYTWSAMAQVINFREGRFDPKYPESSRSGRGTE